MIFIKHRFIQYRENIRPTHFFDLTFREKKLSILPTDQKKIQLMPPEDRRTFVKKSVATSVTISFAGLIRAAHGATTLPFTVDPWGSITNTTHFDPWGGDAYSGQGPTVPVGDFTWPWQTSITENWFSGGAVTDPPVITECEHIWQYHPVPHVAIDGTVFYPRWCSRCGVE